jgi:hypothetical protein
MACRPIKTCHVANVAYRPTAPACHISDRYLCVLEIYYILKPKRNGTCEGIHVSFIFPAIGSAIDEHMNVASYRCPTSTEDAMFLDSANRQIAPG